MAVPDSVVSVMKVPVFRDLAGCELFSVKTIRKEIKASGKAFFCVCFFSALLFVPFFSVSCSFLTLFARFSFVFPQRASLRLLLLRRK